jgi:hypothetical protein
MLGRPVADICARRRPTGNVIPNYARAMLNLPKTASVIILDI